ncbi:MAG: DUF2029 domain-containing protein, partial [Bdellovibrionales bacterium]|nr:DUF2029 domain-containing protein [Bdellovibrionales bacterium]
MRRSALDLGLIVVYSLALFAGSVALVRHSGHVGNDFIVFWTAARATLEGVFPYGVETGPGMVFKYPPWILPLFFPLALLPLAGAKWVWGVAQVVSIIACVLWLLRRGCSWRIVLGVTLAFWGIWAVHALDGQITLMLLASCLWATEGLRPSGDLGYRGLIILWALSVKIFTVFGLLGVYRPLRKWLTLRHVGVSAALFLALSLPAWWAAPDRNPGAIVEAWVSSASSGGEALGGEKIRSRVNQGFPVMVLRLLEVRASRTSMDVLAFLLAALVLGGVWSIASAGLPFPERWVGWLALTAAVHPLSWFHSFVMAFPLAALALDRAWARRERMAILLAGSGVVLIALLT